MDPLARKGYRFKGRATVVGEGPEFAAALEFYRRRGSSSPKRHVVLVSVEHAEPLVSPAYDGGQSEEAITTHWRAYWEQLWTLREPARAPE